jgi:hypothetical protein
MFHFIHFFFAQSGDLLEESEVNTIVTKLTPSIPKIVHLQPGQIEDPLGRLVVIRLGQSQYVSHQRLVRLRDRGSQQLFAGAS